MEQISVSFKDLNSLVNWCKRVAEDPQEALFGATHPNADKIPAPKENKKKEAEAPATTKKEEKTDAPAAAAAAETTGVSKLLADLKDTGVELTEMQPSRYDGVQLALASFGVTKIKELSEEDQPKCLKMFNKMKAASKEDYADMLAYLKQQ